MDDKTYPFWCEYCCSIKYGKPPKPEKDDPNIWRSNPQYICADCLRKLINKENAEKDTGA